MSTVTYQPPDQEARATPQQRDGQAAQFARRREAARRLPPLPCGCRDPETSEHIAGHCQHSMRAAA